MATHHLTVDLGNTRCKLRLFRVAEDARPRVVRRAEFSTRPGLSAEVAGWIGEEPVPAAAFVSSVAPPELDAEIEDALRTGCPAGVWAPPEPGVLVRCRDAHTIGLDRLFAARGAAAALGGSAVVVDAGTALTVDAVLVEDGRPCFLGGAIAPGPELLARALSGGAARLPAVEVDPRAEALGQDTPGAIRAGVAVGFRGAAERLVRSVAAAAGLDDAPVVLTGGARGFLSLAAAERTDASPIFGERRVHEVPELVGLGLLVAGREALADAAGSATSPAAPPEAWRLA